MDQAQAQPLQRGTAELSKLRGSPMFRNIMHEQPCSRSPVWAVELPLVGEADTRSRAFFPNTGNQ